MADKLNFVCKYLDIEKLRFKEKFVFSVEEDEALAVLKVPKMSVMIFVENSIKHGQMHKERDRQLWITIASFESGLKIGIRDNEPAGTLVEIYIK